MTKRKTNKRSDTDIKSKKITASHLMLYVILFIYICVVFSGLVFLKVCLDKEDRQTAFQLYSVLASTTTVCGTATIGFYVFKAKKENEIQMSNGKYRMRLELAKEIYREFKGQTLDGNAMQFMRTLISDDAVHFDDNNDGEVGTSNITNWQSHGQVISEVMANNNDDGLG